MHFRKLQKRTNSLKFFCGSCTINFEKFSVEFPLTATKAFRPHMWDFLFIFSSYPMMFSHAAAGLHFYRNFLFALYKFQLNEKKILIRV